MMILATILDTYMHITGYIVHFVILPAYVFFKIFDVPW